VTDPAGGGVKIKQSERKKGDLFKILKISVLGINNQALIIFPFFHNNRITIELKLMCYLE